MFCWLASQDAVALQLLGRGAVGQRVVDQVGRQRALQPVRRGHEGGVHVRTCDRSQAAEARKNKEADAHRAIAWEECPGSHFRSRICL